MIDGNQFVATVKACYNFLISEFGFVILEEKIRGNAFYDIQYKDKTRIISISYENIEDFLQVIVFLLQNGEMPEYDDKTKTLHLSSLNERVLSNIAKSEIIRNNAHFENFATRNELEKKLLKSAKELRLCLKHFNELH